MNSIYLHDVVSVKVGPREDKPSMGLLGNYGVQHITVEAGPGKPTVTDICLFFAHPAHGGKGDEQDI